MGYYRIKIKPNKTIYIEAETRQEALKKAGVGAFTIEKIAKREFYINNKEEK